jgi:hypothetical protein
MDPFDPLNTGNPDADKARRLIEWFRKSLGEKALEALAKNPKSGVGGVKCCQKPSWRYWIPSIGSAA